MHNWNKEWQQENEDGSLLIDRRSCARTAPVEGTYVWVAGDVRVNVEMLDESEAGIGVLLPSHTSFAFGPDVQVDYMGSRRVASVVHLTKIENGFRLGLQWKGPLPSDLA